MATVTVTPDTLEELAKLPRVIRERIGKLFERLEAWPQSAAPSRSPAIWPAGIACGPAITASVFASKAKPSSWTRSGIGGSSMKTKSAEQKQAACPAHMVKGKRMVMLDEAAYEELLRKADLWEPDLPAPDADGNYPALVGAGRRPGPRHSPRPPQAGAVASRAGPPRRHPPGNPQPHRTGQEQAERADHRQDRPGA